MYLPSQNSPGPKEVLRKVANETGGGEIKYQGRIALLGLLSLAVWPFTKDNPEIHDSFMRNFPLYLSMAFGVGLVTRWMVRTDARRAYGAEKALKEIDANESNAREILNARERVESDLMRMSGRELDRLSGLSIRHEKGFFGKPTTEVRYKRK